MPLEQKELKRRVAAAIRYAGLNQDTLGEKIEAELGTGLKDPEQVMQGKKEMRPGLAEVFGRHTGFPPEWFLSEEAGPRATAEVLTELLAGVQGLRTDIAQVRSELEEVRSQLQRDGRNQGEVGGK